MVVGKHISLGVDGRGFIYTEHDKEDEEDEEERRRRRTRQEEAGGNENQN